MHVPGDPGGSNFMGVISGGAAIERVNMSSAGAEGLDDVQAWAPEPASLSLLMLGGLALLRRR